MPSIAQNIIALHQQMNATAKAFGRPGDSVKLIAVSKFHPEGEVRQAMEAGQRFFGENRVQEAKSKFMILRQDYPDLELHLIGPLQSNKAEDAVRLFDVIQTVDRPKLAEALAKAIQKIGRTPRLYVEVNVGNEPQKAGVAPDNLAAFLTLCNKNYGLMISGLMCIPPQESVPDDSFAHMKILADTHHLPHLSMGMSADFKSAIRHGATEVRLGTAIFGARLQKSATDI